MPKDKFPVTIRTATTRDARYLLGHDKHIPARLAMNKIASGEYLIAVTGGQRTGFLRFGSFWSHIPFIDLIFVDPSHRGEGIGRALLSRLEADSRKKGEVIVMSSSCANEASPQKWHIKNGFIKSGSIRRFGAFPQKVAEILFIKNL